MNTGSSFYKLLGFLVGGVVLLILIFTALRIYNNMQIANTEPENLKVMDDVKAELQALNNSGQTGEVHLQDVNGQTKITIKTSQSLQTPQPSSIRAGTCNNLGAINYRLSDVVNGSSETGIAPAMHFLHGLGDLAVVIHKSEAEAGVAVSCTNLKPVFDKEME